MKRRDCRAPKPCQKLLHCGLNIFRSPMPAQQLGQVLRERRPGQYHVAPHFVRLLLQIALHVRQEPDNRSALLQLALKLRDKSQRFDTVIVEIEDNQRRLFIPVLLHLLHQLFICLHKLNLDVEFARGFLNLRHEE